MAMPGSDSRSLPHQRGQQVGSHPVGGRDRDHAAHGLRAAGGRQPQGLGGGAHGACMLQQVQPGGRERHGLAHPLEEGHAHALLDGRHLAAQRGLGQIPACARPPTASRFQRSPETPSAGSSRGYPCADVYVHCNLPQFLSKLRMDSIFVLTPLERALFRFCPCRLPCHRPSRRSLATHAPRARRPPARPVSGTASRPSTRPIPSPTWLATRPRCGACKACCLRIRTCWRSAVAPVPPRCA